MIISTFFGIKTTTRAAIFIVLVTKHTKEQMNDYYVKQYESVNIKQTRVP